MVRVNVLWQATDIATHDEQLWRRLQSREKVIRAANLRANANGPVSYALVSVPVDRLPRTNGSSDVRDIHELAAINRIELGQATERAATVGSDRIVAEHLGIQEGDRITRTERLILTKQGEPIEWKVTSKGHALHRFAGFTPRRCRRSSKARFARCCIDSRGLGLSDSAPCRPLRVDLASPSGSHVSCTPG